MICSWISAPILTEIRYGHVTVVICSRLRSSFSTSFTLVMTTAQWLWRVILIVYFGLFGFANVCWSWLEQSLLMILHLRTQQMTLYFMAFSLNLDLRFNYIISRYGNLVFHSRNLQWVWLKAEVFQNFVRVAYCTVSLHFERHDCFHNVSA